MTPAPSLPRDLLAAAFDNPRLIVAFEQQAQALTETQQQTGEAVEATSALQDASFVTLSPNGALTGERVLKVGPGIKIAVTEGEVTLSVNDEVPHVQGGFVVAMTTQGPTNLVLPVSGTLATRSGDEVLSNKTLSSVKLAGVGDYTDDTTAAAGGVPVNGVYRTGSALKVRVA